MTAYQHFIGIDIGKFNFVAALYGNKQTHEYEYNEKGICSFLSDFEAYFPSALSILETTGGYERELLLALCAKGFKVHRANTRKVKNFILSYGNAAKTDSLDARALALYGHERNERLEIFSPVSEVFVELYGLVQRRKDLKKMLVAEKNRAKSPQSYLIKESCEAILIALSTQINKLTVRIETIIASDPSLSARKAILKTIPGVGDIIAQELITLMPELGTLTRRQAASLAGVAPRAHDSGKLKGYRRTGHGRDEIKPMLFLAAMSARRSNSPLKLFYETLINRGKKKMVALTALMRKLIVIANARLAEWHKQQILMPEKIF
jgi:transposase